MLKQGLAVFCALALLLVGFPGRWVEAREVSKAGQVYHDVKDGVVTIIGAGHGSGFLIDPQGLVLTNSHVVNDTSQNLRVRFGQEQVFQGVLLENDRDADVAVLWVNLANVKNFKVLQPFIPTEGDSLVVVGEKVIVIGSPIHWESLEKTMTEGVVSKFADNIIHHDASVNGGNSGGPLLNFDGQVVGLNTYTIAANGPAISGTVPITKALPVVERAREKLKTATKPSDKSLPDIPREPYSAELLAKTEKGPIQPYKLTSSYFTLSIRTPPLAYRALRKKDDKVLAERKKRGKEKGFEVSDDEYESKNQFKFYEYVKPVVTVYASPNPKLTTGSIFANILLGAAAGFGGYYYTPTVVQLVFRKDFLSMNLVDKAGNVVCEPYLSSRQAFTEDVAQDLFLSYVGITDKSYMGVYEFDSKCFENKEAAFFVITPEGTKEKPIRIALPETVRNNVVNDFKPYWERVAEKSKPPVLAKTSEEVKELERIIKEGTLSPSASK